MCRLRKSYYTDNGTIEVLIKREDGINVVYVQNNTGVSIENIELMVGDDGPIIELSSSPGFGINAENGNWDFNEYFHCKLYVKPLKANKNNRKRVLYPCFWRHCDEGYSEETFWEYFRIYGNNEAAYNIIEETGYEIASDYYIDL